MKYITILAPTLLLLTAAVTLSRSPQASTPSVAERTAEVRNLTQQIGDLSSKLDNLTPPAPSVPRGLGAVEMPTSDVASTPVASGRL